jgi:methylated-DNA-protein-cysteine methyltransferase-like protein
MSMFDDMRAVVRRIPKGRVMTYGEVALAAGYPTGSRQVAWALKHADPLLPWHRVIGKGGKVLLRGSNGVEQVQRLSAEGVETAGSRIDLARFGFIPRRRNARSRPARPDAAPSRTKKTT